MSLTSDSNGDHAAPTLREEYSEERCYPSGEEKVEESGFTLIEPGLSVAQQTPVSTRNINHKAVNLSTFAPLTVNTGGVNQFTLSSKAPLHRHGAHPTTNRHRALPTMPNLHPLRHQRRRSVGPRLPRRQIQRHRVYPGSIRACIAVAGRRGSLVEGDGGRDVLRDIWA